MGTRSARVASMRCFALGVVCVVWTAPSIAGTISGEVTDESTGQGFPICVDFYDELGGWITSSCPGDGVYQSPPLDPGTYYVGTNNWMGYYDEVYQDTLCNPMCDVTVGTPIVLGTGDVTDIDFALQPGGGSIGGVVTDAATGAGVAFAPVKVYDITGEWVTFGWLNPPDGVYGTKGALETGTYFAVVSPPGFFGELYDDIPCPNESCDPTTGTPITVNAGSQTWGVHFQLVPYWIFGDDFESGNTSAWSVTVP